MQAIIHTRYGGPEGLRLAEIPAPTPKAGQALVRVKAASLHADIWHVMTGKPYFARLMGAGLFGPGGRVPGTDYAGVIEALGPGVEGWQLGEEVYGESVLAHQWLHGGTFAELAAVPVAKMARKPAALNFEEAAALPTSGFIACQAVYDEGKIQAGQRVLVNGAAGGVGALSLQLAKAEGARVWAVDLAERLAGLEALGAERVLDGRREDFTALGERFDLIIDIPGNRPLDACLDARAPGGRYVYIGHDGYGRDAGPWVGSMARMLKMWWRQKRRGESIEFPKLAGADWRFKILGQRVAEGALKVPLDRVFPLAQAPEALRLLSEGQLKGKAVLRIPG
jgi:NADPH:quinone reductase-like Zn-dependent oxidoreductase